MLRFLNESIDQELRMYNHIWRFDRNWIGYNMNNEAIELVNWIHGIYEKVDNFHHSGAAEFVSPDSHIWPDWD